MKTKTRAPKSTPKKKVQPKQTRKPATQSVSKAKKKPVVKAKPVAKVKAIPKAKPSSSGRWDLLPKFVRKAPKRASASVRRMPMWAISIGWLAPVLAIILVLSTFKTPSEKTEQARQLKYPVTFTSARLLSLAEQAKQWNNIGERVAYWSAQLQKDPHLLQPLSPGPKTDDIAPVFPNAYDCTTYVETVAALARSRSIDELADQVVAIRYGSDEVSYDTRNHFPEADWIPQNAAKGILRDITVEVAQKSGLAPAYASKLINRGAWLAQQKERPAARSLAATEAQVKKVELPYIPLDKMLDVAKNIPQGAVVNIVRANLAKLPVLISHQGFLVWKDGVPYFRHASRNKQIREVPLAKYVAELKRMPWRVVGVNVNTFIGFNVNAFSG